MKSLILGLIIMVGNNIFGQGFVGASVFPNPCFEDDTIFVLDTVQTAMAFDYRMGTKIFKRTDTIFIKVCYKIEPGPTSGRDDYSKTNIGKLPKGVYTLKLYGTSTIDTACFSGDPMNELTLEFEVHSFPNAVKEINSSIFCSLYPNPTENATLLEIYTSNYQQINISLADLAGKLILNKTEEVNGVKNIPIDVSNLTFGIYILTVKSDNLSKTFKILKQ